MECSASGGGVGDGDAELDSVWAEDDHCVIGAEGAARYVDDGLFLIYLRPSSLTAPAENQENSVDPDNGKVHHANRAFARNHAMVIHLNAIALVATVWYGFTLSSSLVDGF